MHTAKTHQTKLPFKNFPKLSNRRCHFWTWQNRFSTKNLQFDHKNPKIKEFRISSKIDAPEITLIKEVKKCILLCDKCHREKTKASWDFGVNKPKHGTIWFYKSRGCRCKKCKEAMSNYLKAKAQNLKWVIT